jgi:hypothetical protein
MPRQKKTLRIRLVQQKKPVNAATKNITNKPGAAEKKLANAATKHTTNTPGAAEKISQSRDKQHYEYA